jgi:5-methylcytosine-specific restriction endonuclease McrA
MAANQRGYRKLHPSRIKEQQTAWLKNHPTYERDRARRRYANDPQRQHRATKKWEAKFPEKRRAVNLRAQTKRRARELGQTLAENRLTAGEWQDILARYDGRCAYCFDLTDKPQKEHVVPLARGGQHVARNIVPACRSCNSQKRTKLLSEWLFERGGARCGAGK